MNRRRNPCREPAIDGGTPVRSTPLRAGYWGTQFYDEQERVQLLEVLEAKSPFRWYGANPPAKVLPFEKEFAARMQTKFALAVTSGTVAIQCAIAKKHKLRVLEDCAATSASTACN